MIVSSGRKDGAVFTAEEIARLPQEFSRVSQAAKAALARFEAGPSGPGTR